MRLPTQAWFQGVPRYASRRSACASNWRTVRSPYFFFRAENVKTYYASEVRESLADVTRGIVSSLTGNVYISIDLDVFDPGIMPAVGTPEPGGLDWFEVIDVLRDVMRTDCNIVGFDIMELSPISGIVAPDFLAAKLCYRIMGWVLARREEA